MWQDFDNYFLSLVTMVTWVQYYGVSEGYDGCVNIISVLPSPFCQ